MHLTEQMQNILSNNSRIHIFFSSTHETFSRGDHILGHRTSLSKFKKIEIRLPWWCSG